MRVPGQDPPSLAVGNDLSITENMVRPVVRGAGRDRRVLRLGKACLLNERSVARHIEKLVLGFIWTLGMTRWLFTELTRDRKQGGLGMYRHLLGFLILL